MTSFVRRAGTHAAAPSSARWSLPASSRPFKKLYGDSWGPRLEHILRALLHSGLGFEVHEPHGDLSDDVVEYGGGGNRTHRSFTDNAIKE